MTQLDALRADLRAAINPDKAAFFPKFFKAGPGQYAEGDMFLGVTVPNQRVIAKRYAGLQLSDISTLLASKWHEERLTGLFILVAAFNRADESDKTVMYTFYMDHIDRINNWDLVDSTASHIVGAYLDNRPEKMKVLTLLAQSEHLWRRRIAIISTLFYIVNGRAEEALVIAELLVDDQHDLIQKAVGWMLREVGKRVDRTLLEDFLNKHAATMPRTTLRYAIEHFDQQKRLNYLAMKDRAA